MNAKGKIEAVAITAIMVASVFGAIAPMASSYIPLDSVSVTDNGDDKYFVNETIYVTWKNNATGDTATNWLNVTNNSGGSIWNKSVQAYDLIGTYYYFNATVPLNDIGNISCDGVHKYYINATCPANASTNHSEYSGSIVINNITAVKLSTPSNATVFTSGESVLIGDTLKVDVITFGPLANTSRTGANLNWVVNNNTQWGLATGALSDNASSPGNYTAEIDTKDIGVGENYNVSINSSSCSGNAYINKSVSFNVTKLMVNISAVKAGTTNTGFFTKFNTTNSTGTPQPVNRTYNFTVTIDDVRPDDEFNYTYSDSNITLVATNGKNRTAYLMLFAGNYTVGNITLLNLTAGSGTTPGKIWVKNDTIGYNESFEYSVGTENISINTPTTDQVFDIGTNITISGVCVNTTTALNVSVTYLADTSINLTLNSTNGLLNASGLPCDNISTVEKTLYANKTFYVIWNTNTTWNGTSGMLPAGKWQINLSNSSWGQSATVNITLRDHLEVDTDVASTTLSKPFNITVLSSRLNGTKVDFNLTMSSKIINNTLNTTLGNYSIVAANRSNATYLCNLSKIDLNFVNLTQTRSSWSGRDTGNASNTLLIFANTTTSNENATATITLWDNMTLTVPSTAVPGQPVPIRGTITRLNGTGVNLTITGTNYENTTIYNITYGYNATTGLSQFSATWVTTVGGTGTPLEPGTYEIKANDTFVNKTVSIILGAAEILPTISTTHEIDAPVYINGTTNLANGTILTANITKGTTIINNTINGTVAEDGSFSIVFYPNDTNNMKNMSTVFTQPSTEFNVNVTNATYYNNTCTFYLNDTLTVDDVAVVPGDPFNITGTSSRADGTGIWVNITGINVDNSTVVPVYNGEYNRTGLYATYPNFLSTDTDLSPGNYTISVNDNVTTATANLTVAAATMELTAPTAGQKFNLNSTVSINGTSNRADGTPVNISINGPAGYTNDTISTTVQGGEFSAVWDTSDAYDKGIGIYYISVTIGTLSRATSVELIPAVIPGPPSITDFSPTDTTPANVEGESRTFSITVNQTVDVSWQINGTEVQTNTSVTEASYTNASAVIGVWNVSAIASNANGTAIQTWIWTVTAPVAEVAINELLPDPVGTDTGDNEFIELYNYGNTSTDITGWKLEDASGKNYTLTGTIDAGEFKLLWRNETGITLNNDEDTIYLNNSAGTIVDSYHYTSSTEGKSWARIPDGAGEWQEADPTPGEANAVPDWNPWDDDGKITDTEISLAEYHWATNTPINEHIITDSEISLLEYQWATGIV